MLGKETLPLTLGLALDNKFGYLRSVPSSHVLATMHVGRAHRSAGPEGAIPTEPGIGPLFIASLSKCRTTSTPPARSQLSYRYHSPSRTTSFVERLSFPLPVHSVGRKEPDYKDQSSTQRRVFTNRLHCTSPDQRVNQGGQRILDKSTTPASNKASAPFESLSSISIARSSGNLQENEYDFAARTKCTWHPTEI